MTYVYPARQLWMPLLQSSLFGLLHSGHTMAGVWRLHSAATAALVLDALLWDVECARIKRQHALVTAMPLATALVQSSCIAAGCVPHLVNQQLFVLYPQCHVCASVMCAPEGVGEHAAKLAFTSRKAIKSDTVSASFN